MTAHPHSISKKTCSACGTSPVNHRATYIMTVVDDTMTSMMHFLLGWVRVPREGRIANMVTAGFVGTFRLFGLAHFDTDIEKAISGRSKLIWQEATRRGIPVEQIVMFGKHLEQYRATIGGKRIYFQSIPIPYWLPQKGYDWMDDKFALSKRLNAAHINAPKAATVSSWRKTRQEFARMQKPVIIKPRSGSRGRHTTTNIHDETALRTAYDLAKEIAPTLVIEEHLYGSVYRATVIDNVLVGFFRADPPQITGDGIHTIEELIDLANTAKNADPAKKERLGDITITEDTTSFIARYGHTIESILLRGTTLDLSAKTGRHYGGYTREMLPEIHPKIREIFQKAGEIIQASIVGFDIIMEDPAKDPDTQTWGIIEANSLPFIDLHYYALEGTPIDLAKNVWDLWEEKLKKK